MVELDQESEKTCGMSTWRIYALISANVAFLLGLIWIMTGINGVIDEWIIAAQLFAIVSLASWVIFVVIDKDESGKKPRVLIVIFLFLIFIILPVRIWMLPESGGNSVYNSLKFSAPILPGLFGFMVVTFIIQKYATKRKGFDKLSELGRRFDRLPPWKKYPYVVIVVFAIVVVWEVFDTCSVDTLTDHRWVAFGTCIVDTLGEHWATISGVVVPAQWVLGWVKQYFKKT